MEATRNRRFFPLAAGLATGLLLLILAFGANTAAAAESPFKISFDSSEIGVSVIKDLPLDSLSTKASIEGTIDEAGNVTIPKGGFKMPELGITEPVGVKGFMGIESAATGTFDAATGRLDLDGKAGIWVSIDVKQALALAETFGVDLSGIGAVAGFLPPTLTCGFSPMDIHFTTEGEAGGARFAKGPDGPGAISAEWSQLGKFTGRGLIDSFACGFIKSQLPTLLESLGGGTELGGFDLGALLGDIDLTQLDDVDLGPSSITLTRTTDDGVIIVPPPGDPEDPAAAKLKLSVTPKARRAKAGAKVKYRATVKNVGGSAAGGVKVCIKVPKKAAAVKRCQGIGKLAPGAKKVRKFNLKLKKSAAHRSYKIGFETRSHSGGKPRARTSLRVR